MTLRDQSLENEERASLALGAMDGLERLLAGLDPRHEIRPADLAYLFKVVNQSVHAAIDLPCTTGGASSNDDELPG